MATLAQFSRNIRKRGRQVEEGGARITKKISKRALRSLVLATPVDKGVTRSNWRVGLGAPTRSVIGAYRPYPKGSQANGQGRAESANANAAIAAGNARINSLRAPLTKAIFISNNAPAIGPLNGGSSTQAPAGFVQIATAEARAELAAFRIFTR